MSKSDVDPDEMNTNNLSDDAIDALMAGDAHELDTELAQLLVSLRAAYTSSPLTIGAELAAILASAPAPTPTLRARLVARARSSLTKIGAATAAVLAATSGLAVANALPAPIQNVISHLGIGASPHTQHHDTPITTPTPTTVLTAPPTTHDNHGTAVSTIAHNHTSGCPHGVAVSQTASAKRTHNPHNCGTSNPANKTTPTTGAHNHAPKTPPPATAYTNRANNGHRGGNTNAKNSQANNK